MQTVSRSLQSLFQTESVGLSAHARIGNPISMIAGLMYPAKPMSSDWTWEDCKVKIMRLADLAPDLCTFAESTNALVALHYHVVPTALRVAFASTGMLNLLLVPDIAKVALELITRFLPRLAGKGLGGTIDIGLKMSYISSLTAIFASLGALGINEACRLLNMAPVVLEKVLFFILPYLGYLVRLSAVLQLMDIYCGDRFQEGLNRAELRATRKSYQHLEMNRYDFVVAKICGSYAHAKESLAVIKDNRRYLRRMNGNALGVKATVTRLEAGLQSWNPITLISAIRETNSLTEKLRERSVEFTRYQIYGLGANFFAASTMVVSNAVALPILAMCSASWYIRQTVANWNMVPAVQFHQKSA